MKTLFSKIVIIALMQGMAGSLSAHVGLDYPVGGETLISGTTVTIQWHIEIPHNTLNWDLLFSSDGGATWEFIQMDLPVNNLSYQWVVPSTITSQARVSVIQDNSGTDYQDESMNFTIAAPPMLPFIVSGAIDTVIESDINQYDAIQTWLDNNGGAIVTSFCEDLIWTNDFITLSNDCGNTGSALVTFTATDECGSTETVATLTVVDTSPPVLVQEASPLLVECDGTGNIAQLNAWIGIHGGAIVALDEDPSFSWVVTISGTESGCAGTSITSFIFAALDDCNNSTSTLATFTIEDHTAPDIQIPAMDTIIECGLPSTQAVLQSWLDRQGGAIANDVCGSVIWSNNFSAVPDTCVGTNNVAVIFTGTDECGNSKSTSAILTLLGISGTMAPDHEVAVFTLSPNPVSDMLKIDFKSHESLLVYLTLMDACGKPVVSYREWATEFIIPVNTYAPGIYYLQAETKLGVSIQKVIIN